MIVRSAWRDRSDAVPDAKSEDDKLKALAQWYRLPWSVSQRNKSVMGTHELDKLNETRTSLKPEGVDEIGKHLRSLSADVFALYLKTKNFHWLPWAALGREYWRRSGHAGKCTS